MNGGYSSTACRTGDHTTCQRHPVVECSCPCHRLNEIRREIDSLGKWRLHECLSPAEQQRYDLLIDTERFLLARMR